MKLNGRLLSIAGKLIPCDILVDIGTDHGYIPIYAVKNNICRRAIGTDLREGPLKAALRNIKKNAVEGRVELRQGNGLESVLLEECDQVVISGMGGTLIRDILSESIEKAKRANFLVLQPNTALYHLRKWLYESGFDISDETLSLDAGKFYVIMRAKWNGVPEKFSDVDYYLGVRLFSGNDPLLDAYLKRKLNEVEVILEGRAKSRGERGYDGEISTEACIGIKERIVEYLERRMVK